MIESVKTVAIAPHPGSTPRELRAPLQLLASCPRGLADLLARELTALEAQDVRERSTGVAFAGTLATAYRVCLWSRTANRVFLELARLVVAEEGCLHRGGGAVMSDALRLEQVPDGPGIDLAQTDVAPTYCGRR